MEPAKYDMKMMQGLSVLAMICLHLFNRLDYTGLFHPLIHIFGYPLSFYFSQLSDFCIMGFAFCSGYAHMLLYQNDKKNYYPRRLVRLLKVIVNIWIVLILFTVVSMIVGQSSYMPGSLIKFLANFFLVSSSYNGAWWYALTYILIVLISPVILHLQNRYNTIVVLLIAFIVYCLSFYMHFRADTTGWFMQQLYLLGMTLFEYILGSAFCKENLFLRITTLWDKYITSRWLLAGYALLVVVFIAMLAGHTLIIRSFFIAPFTGIVLLIGFQIWNKPEIIRKFFHLVGNHSTNLWLTHMFFYAVLFTNLVYIAKYPILIYSFMIVLTLIVSWCIRLVYEPISKGIDILAGKLLKDKYKVMRQ